jgi:hypothetical protein
MSSSEAVTGICQFSSQYRTRPIREPSDMSCMHDGVLTNMQALLIGELTSTSEVLPPPHFEVRAA